MNRPLISTSTSRFWQLCVLTSLVMTINLTAQETPPHAKDTHKEDGKTFEHVLKGIGGLRARNMNEVVKQSRQLFLAPSLDKTRSVPAKGYFVWDEFLAQSYYYDKQLIRTDTLLVASEISTERLIQKFEEKYGPPTAGLKYASLKSFDLLLNEQESLGYTIKKSVHWDIQYDLKRKGEQPLPIAVTIEISQIDVPESRVVKKNGKVEITPAEEVPIISFNDTEQVEAVLKVIELK